MKALYLGFIMQTLLCAAELKDVKSVYLYPMVGGLDQHLANRLTKDHIFRVVSDPKLADALFTDQLGKQFEYRVDHIKRDVDKPAVAPSPQLSGGPIPTVMGQEVEPHGSSFSAGKGTVFLVDAKSRQVVWSDYRQPKDTSARKLEETAKRLTKDIAKTLAPPAPKKP